MTKSLNVNSLWKEFVNSVSASLEEYVSVFIFSGVKVRDDCGRIGELCFSGLNGGPGLYLLQNTGFGITKSEYLCNLSAGQTFSECILCMQTVNHVEYLQKVFTYWCTHESEKFISKMEPLQNNWRSFTNSLRKLGSCNGDLQNIRFFNHYGFFDSNSKFVLLASNNGNLCVYKKAKNDKRLQFVFSISEYKPFCDSFNRPMDYYSILVTLAIADHLEEEAAKKNVWQTLCNRIKALNYKSQNWAFNTDVMYKWDNTTETLYTYGFTVCDGKPALVHLLNHKGEIFQYGACILLDQENYMQSLNAQMSNDDLKFLHYCCDNRDRVFSDMETSGVSITRRVDNDVQFIKESTQCIWDIIPKRYYSLSAQKTLESLYDVLVGLKTDKGTNAIASLLTGIKEFKDETTLLLENLKKENR